MVVADCLCSRHSMTYTKMRLHITYAYVLLSLEFSGFLLLNCFTLKFFLRLNQAYIISQKKLLIFCTLLFRLPIPAE